MPLEIVRNDITRMRVDAIVNAANNSLLGGGGVDGAIHQAAGPGLLEECRGLGGCATGEAKITKGYRLPCRYVIHTVGPVWTGGQRGEGKLLAACYRNALELAEKNGCETVAFPLISAGAYGFPRDQAFRIAGDAIRDFLLEHDMLVYLVVFDRRTYAISQKLYANIQTFIDDAYVGPDFEEAQRIRRQNANSLQAPFHKPAPLPMREEKSDAEAFPEAIRTPEKPAPEPADALQEEARAASVSSILYGFRVPKTLSPPEKPGPADYLQEEACAFAASSLEDFLSSIDEGFREMLLRKIDERGMTDAECYKRANVDRKLFNKIKNVREYKPGKSIVLAFAVALRLPLDETQDMLRKAGFSLSHSSKFDLIVEYFIRRGNYDIFEINEALFSFDQKLLGSVM